MPSNLDTAYFLPYDPTGELVTNRVSGEYHSVPAGQKSVLRCNYGAFFSDDFTLYWRGANESLTLMTLGVDYQFAQFDEVLSAQLGKAIYKAVLITNETLPGIYAVTYQAVGGYDNPHVPNVWSAAFQNVTNDTAVPFSTIDDQPDFYPPATHMHDARDVFGAEYLRTIANKLLFRLQQQRLAFGNTGRASSDAELGFKIDAFRNTLRSGLLALRGNISAHLANAGYPHAYTKAQVGLGNVSNGEFVAAQDQSGNQLPVYANPAAISSALAVIPAATSNTHASEQGHVHSLTAAQVGLGGVFNVGFYETYATGDYQTLFSPNAPLKYASPHFTKSGLQEAIDAHYQSNWVVQVNSLEAPGGALQNVTDRINSAASAVSAATTAIAQANTAVNNALIGVAQADATNRRFKLVEYNATLAAQLNAIAAYDYGRAAVSSGVSRDGLYPVPEKIPNLALWLDFSYHLNTYTVDANGTRRLMRLVDRSPEARIFSSQSVSTAPKMAASLDVANGAVGMTANPVAHFVSGTNMQQIFGSAFTLKPGMTVIAMVRTSDALLPLNLMVNSEAVPLASIVAQPSSGVALKVGTPNWNALRAAPGTVNANQSAIVVASISDVDESECWYAGSKTIPKATYPRGTDTPPSAWLADYARTAALTIVGSANGNQAGEVAHLIAFYRQLSVAEVSAVVNYLRLAETNNQALSVDFSAKLAF